MSATPFCARLDQLPLELLPIAPIPAQTLPRFPIPEQIRVGHPAQTFAQFQHGPFVGFKGDSHHSPAVPVFLPGTTRKPERRAFSAAVGTIFSTVALR
jgi:hypothetical protein